MNRNKFEYFLNAVHYCMWLYSIKLRKSIDQITEFIFSPISKYLLTKEFKRKYHEQLSKEQEGLDKLFYRMHIRMANYWFEYICSGYPFFLSFILGALAIKFYGNFSFYLFLFMAVIPAIPCYILVDKMVFTNDRYLTYFKKFEKEDEAWHKKWKRRTMLFTIGSIMMILLGIAAMFAIWILIPEP